MSPTCPDIPRTDCQSIDNPDVDITESRSRPTPSMPSVNSLTFEREAPMRFVPHLLLQLLSFISFVPGSFSTNPVALNITSPGWSIIEPPPVKASFTTPSLSPLSPFFKCPRDPIAYSITAPCRKATTICSSSSPTMSFLPRMLPTASQGSDIALCLKRTMRSNRLARRRRNTTITSPTRLSMTRDGVQTHESRTLTLRHSVPRNGGSGQHFIL